MVESSNDSDLNEKSTSDEATSCPMCGKHVPDEANRCPSCGEPFSADAFTSVTTKEEKGSRLLFWSGVILVLAGGPGVALGSWLHDYLRVPIGDFTSFDSFGWVNQTASLVGIVILVVGIILLILSLPKLHSEADDDEELPEVVPEDSDNSEEELIEETITTGDQGG